MEGQNYFFTCCAKCGCMTSEQQYVDKEISIRVGLLREKNGARVNASRESYFMDEGVTRNDTVLDCNGERKTYPLTSLSSIRYSFATSDVPRLSRYCIYSCDISLTTVGGSRLVCRILSWT